MRFFGRLAYAHQNEGKLEPRVVKCFFLGFLEGTKGYKVIVNRDVVFKKDVIFCLSDCIVGTSAQQKEDSAKFEVELAKPI